MSVAGSLDSVTSPPVGFPPRARLRPSTTLVDYLEPHLGAEDSRPATPHRGVSESPHTLDTERGHESTLNFGVVVSPIGSGLVSENEAKYLYQQFIDRVSTTSGLFDPHYHTYARVSQSLALFTACIYAASRYFRPALSDQLFVLASNNIAKKVQNGDVDVPLIQALLVLVSWKAPSDRTSYIKLGLAVRLMYQLRLEFPTEVVPLPSADDESRRLVDAERTVCILIGLDLSYSLMFQLPAACHPSMMPTEAQLERWAECHKHHKVAGDAFKPFLSSLWEFHEDTAVFPRTNLDVKHAPWAWEARERKLYEHLDKMRSNPEVQGVLRISGEILGRVQIIKVGAIGLLQYQQARGRAAHLLSLAEDVSVFIKQLFETGDIIFWSDLWSYALLLPGLLLHCARHHFGPDEVARAKVFCNEMWRVFDQVPREFGDHPLRYIERTYRRLYGAFDRLQKGGEEPQSEEAAIQSILQGQWPAMGPVIGGETQDGQPAEWNWLWSSVPLSWSESTNNSSPALK
ncbi:hypothetical protein Q8F55_005066 [Vanrija albida]|uniref:Transcription factor domain-containing protein n=1 Tax=Vanrija albida TaxID=181172 RepID=A0ABR3Q0T8_9TREE